MMNKKFLMICLMGMLLLAASSVSAQELDSTAVKRIVHLQERLKVSVDTATAVNQILSVYKQAVHVLMATTQLSQQQKETAMKELIAEKNKKLGLLLSPFQQEKVIPKSERTEDYQQQTPNPVL